MTELKQEIREKLIEKAKKARENAYVPYSNFPIGVALLTTEGEIFSGCNVENASYGLTICAERAAIARAVTEGYRDFEALVLITDTEKTISPCGACRQVLTEFGADIDIIMTNYQGKEVTCKSGDLLPGYFNKGDMNNGV